MKKLPMKRPLLTRRRPNSNKRATGKSIKKNYAGIRGGSRVVFFVYTVVWRGVNGVGWIGVLEDSPDIVKP